MSTFLFSLNVVSFLSWSRDEFFAICIISSRVRFYWIILAFPQKLNMFTFQIWLNDQYFHLRLILHRFILKSFTFSLGIIYFLFYSWSLLSFIRRKNSFIYLPKVMYFYLLTDAPLHFSFSFFSRELTSFIFTCIVDFSFFFLRLNPSCVNFFIFSSKGECYLFNWGSVKLIFIISAVLEFLFIFASPAEFI